MNTNIEYNRRTFNKAILAGVAGFGLAGQALGSARKTSFSLGKDQTPTRDQADRGTCFVHAVVAAMEAAYNRVGHKNLDLSEEFGNDALRMFWLDPKSSDKAAERRENFFSMEGGGWDNGVVEMMATCGFAIPKESAMPFRPNLPLGYTKDEHIANDRRWNSQYNVGSFNLFPGHFDSASLSRAEYYGVDSFESHKPNDPERFEEILAAGREIIWGFRYPGRNYSGHAERIWDYTGPANGGGHAMMIYGFDRTNPKKKHFLVKNSYGQKDTFVSYEYVRRFGYDRATSILKVSEPRAWPELAVIGRWSLEIGGRSGVFDLYHLPGMSATAFEAFERKDGEDRRLGTFFVDGDPKKAYRVNGSVGSDGLRLNVDWNKPACSYSHRGGQEFTLRFVGGSQEVMKGKLIGADMAGRSVIAKRLRAKEHFDYVA